MKYFKNKIRRTIAIVCAFLMVCMVMNIPTYAAYTRKCYLINNANTTVYSNSALTRRYGTIYGSDELGEVTPCMKGEYILTNVRSVLPKAVGDSIEEGVRAFGKRISGFDREDALLSGIESRTSSPVRIVRDQELTANMAGIYPCGEGAGYAGGITSAAMDGIKVAETVCRKYAAIKNN